MAVFNLFGAVLPWVFGNAAKILGRPLGVFWNEEKFVALEPREGGEWHFFISTLRHVAASHTMINPPPSPTTNPTQADQEVTVPRSEKQPFASPGLMTDDDDDGAVSKPPPKKKCWTQHCLSDKLLLHFMEAVHNNGVPTACKTFNMPKTTGYQITHKWDPRVGGESIYHKKTGPPPGQATKLTPKAQEWLLEQCKLDNTLTGQRLAVLFELQFKTKIHCSTINKLLAKNKITFKKVTPEAVERNLPQLVEERYKFASLMLFNGYQPADSSSVIYWDQSYFETNVIARHARAPKGQPAIVQQAHCGVYIPKQSNRLIDVANNQAENEDEQITYTEHQPISTGGIEVNTVALCVAVSGTEMLIAQTQYRHFTADDVVSFFEELLAKLHQQYPHKAFTFFGDNLGLYKSILPLFEQQEYQHHSYIPNPQYSPFLNASKNVFNQIKNVVLAKQYKTLRALLVSIHRACELVQPEHLANYHTLVQHYLYQCLEQKEIHANKVKLSNKEHPASSDMHNKWDIRHRQLFTTEKKGEQQPMQGMADNAQLARNKAEMVLHGCRQLMPYSVESFAETLACQSQVKPWAVFLGCCCCCHTLCAMFF